MIPFLPLLTVLLATTQPATAPAYTRQEDILYGRKDGMALTMDVISPTGPRNGAGVIVVISGGWFSSHDAVPFALMVGSDLLKRGYVLFPVVHGSQPRFTIPDAISDLNRGVRFIRTHAGDYHVDPKRLGIVGGSAGGHLSLMMGVDPQPAKPDSKDPVDRAESNVEAVVAFFPPTDFLNYGKEGNVNMGTGTLKDFAAPFDFRELDPAKHVYVKITDEARREKIGREISPAYHASKDDPPTLLIHGDADNLVPIQQSNKMIEKLKAVDVPCELLVRPGKGHGWKDLDEDVKAMGDWFDKYLK